MASFVFPPKGVLLYGPPGEITELLAELREDVVEAPLERPLLVVRFGLGHRRQIEGPRGGRALPPLSNTRSSTSTGTLARIASAMASDGRESSCSSGPPALR